jgi:hypothetical protein
MTDKQRIIVQQELTAILIACQEWAENDDKGYDTAVELLANGIPTRITMLLRRLDAIDDENKRNLCENLSSTLSTTPNGYLPSRHPARLAQDEQE